MELHDSIQCLVLFVQPSRRPHNNATLLVAARNESGSLSVDSDSQNRSHTIRSVSSTLRICSHPIRTLDNLTYRINLPHSTTNGIIILLPEAKKKHQCDSENPRGHAGTVPRGDRYRRSYKGVTAHDPSDYHHGPLDAVPYGPGVFRKTRAVNRKINALGHFLTASEEIPNRMNTRWCRAWPNIEDGDGGRGAELSRLNEESRRAHEEHGANWAEA